MNPTLFFSWQSDTRPEFGKKFILDALNEAASGIDVLPADRLEVDEGMKDVPGSPEVARVLFEKIDQAFVFVGDVTLVGQIPEGGVLLTKDKVVRKDDAVRRVPNPNVAIELGYADGVLGTERVIRVMNTAFGKPEEQPFDVRNRRFPIKFRASPDMSEPELTEAKTKLVAVLKDAIRVASTYQLKRAMLTRGHLDVHTAEMMMHYGKEPWEFPQPKQTDPDSPLVWLRDLDLFHRLTMRLLDLEIIRTNLGINSGVPGYSYMWTPFGKKVRELFPENHG